MTLVRPDGEILEDVDAGTVVAVVPPAPDRSLVEVVEGLGLQCHLIGDVLALRQAWQAFKEGEELALAL